MKEINTTWDYQDDYYFTHIGNIEINIRAYSESDFHLWMYEHEVDKEIVDEDYTSLDALEDALKSLMRVEVILPDIEDLLKITRIENE